MKFFLLSILIIHLAFASGGRNISVNKSSQNGNTATKTRRMLDNGEERVTVTLTSPDVRIDGDEFSCAGVKCPKETFKCHVTSETIASNRNKMKNTIECQDKNGKVLKKEEGTEANPHPEDEPPFSRVATIDREGTINVEDSRNNIMNIGGGTKMTKEQEEELNRNMRRMNQDFAKQMADFEKSMQSSMSNMQANMNNAFGNNFPFGNSNPFGNNFPFHGNSDPFGNMNMNIPLFANNFDPFSNFRTFFYSPPIFNTNTNNNNNNNYNGVVTGYVNYPSYTTSSSSSSYSTPTPSFSEFDYPHHHQDPKESEFAVEEFKPVYRYPSYNNHHTAAPTVNNNFYDKYRYPVK